MGRYFLKRVVQLVPLLLFITFLAFSISEVAPGEPLAMYLPPDQMSITPEQMAALNEKLGLDQPWYLRYFSWLKNTIQGNWGYSLYKHDLVTVEVFSRLPNTLLLGVVSLVVTIGIAVPLGVISAVKRYSLIDYTVTIGAFIGLSLPSFWFALILIEVFANRLGWFPSVGMHTFGVEMNRLESIVDVAEHLVLPTLTLSITQLAHWSRYQRAVLLENLNTDFVRTARSKGAKESMIIWRHAFRNALVPMVTLFGLSFPHLVNGAVITETIFGWPGMGRLGIEAIMSRDYPVIMGVVMLSSFMVVIGNLFADICYALVDPRIRYED